MPVAKVRPRMQMLFKIIGRKALIGGFVALNNINLMLPQALEYFNYHSNKPTIRLSNSNQIK